MQRYLIYRFMPYLLLALGTLFWSTNFLIGRVLAQTVSPFTLCAGRFSVAAVVFAGLAFWFRWPRPRGREWIFVVAMAFTGIFLFNTVLYWGLAYTTAFNATLVNSLNPLVTLLMAVIFLREKTTRRLSVGILSSVLGVTVIAARGDWNIFRHLQFNPGDLLVLAGTFVWGGYTICVRLVTRHFPAVPATVYATWIGVLFLYPAVWNETKGQPLHLSPIVIISFVYLGLFASVLAFLFWNWSVSRIGAMRAAACYNLIPLYAAMLSPLLLSEKLYLFHFIGGLLIVGGVIMGIWPEKKPLPQPGT
jgi:drug/metabolite transporter (DMT)-like permease